MYVPEEKVRDVERCGNTTSVGVKARADRRAREVLGTGGGFREGAVCT